MCIAFNANNVIIIEVISHDILFTEIPTALAELFTKTVMVAVAKPTVRRIVVGEVTVSSTNADPLVACSCNLTPGGEVLHGSVNVKMTEPR